MPDLKHFGAVLRYDDLPRQQAVGQRRVWQPQASLSQKRPFGSIDLLLNVPNCKTSESR